MIPPGMPGFQPDLGKDIDFDPAAAKNLLAQAGFADPLEIPPLRMRFATTSANQSRAEFIQAQLKQNLGVNIQLDSMEAKAYQAAYKDQGLRTGLGRLGRGLSRPAELDGQLVRLQRQQQQIQLLRQGVRRRVRQG